MSPLACLLPIIMYKSVILDSHLEHGIRLSNPFIYIQERDKSNKSGDDTQMDYWAEADALEAKEEDRIRRSKSQMDLLQSQAQMFKNYFTFFILVKCMATRNYDN